MSKRREFKTYKDFHESSTPKSVLASLCVSMRELVLEYEASDARVAEQLKKTHSTVTEAKSAISDEREERKVKIMSILKPIRQKRIQSLQAKGINTDDFPEWKLPSDLFWNITDTKEEVEEGEDTDTKVDTNKEEFLRISHELEKKKDEANKLGIELGQALDNLGNAKRELDEVKDDYSGKLALIKREKEALEGNITFLSKEAEKWKKLAENKTEEGEKNFLTEDDEVDSGKDDVKEEDNLSLTGDEKVVEYKGSYKIDPKTPVFKSKPEDDVETWLYKIENAFEFANVPKRLWPKAAGNYTEGTAFEMVRAACTGNKPWDKLK